MTKSVTTKFNINANELFNICVSAIDAIGKVEKVNEKIGEIIGIQKDKVNGVNYKITLTIMPLGKQESNLSCFIDARSSFFGTKIAMASGRENKKYEELMSKIDFIINREKLLK